MNFMRTARFLTADGLSRDEVLPLGHGTQPSSLGRMMDRRNLQHQKMLTFSVDGALDHFDNQPKSALFHHQESLPLGLDSQQSGSSIHTLIDAVRVPISARPE